MNRALKASFTESAGKPMQRGNSNIGHEYGTALDNEEKRALLEFMKTL